MKKKILTILVSILFIAMIPSTLGDDCEPEEVEIIFMRGLFFHKLRKGNCCNSFTIHFVIWYKTSEGLHRDVYWFEESPIPFLWFESIYLGRMYEVCLGLFTYYCGFVRGGLEVLE